MSSSSEARVEQHTQKTDRIVELWNLIKDQEDPLQVVFCTKDGVFDDIPIKVWWVRGKPGNDMMPQHSRVVFDISDKAWARVQSIYATKVKRKHFEPGDAVNLTRAIRSDSDRDENRKSLFSFPGDGFTEETFMADDWPKLKQAIEATAKSVQHRGSSANIELYGNFKGVVCIEDGQIRIDITDAVTRIVSNWQASLRRKLGFPH